MTKKTTSTFRQKICFCIWSGKQNCNYNWASVSLAVVGHAEPNEIYCSHHDCGIFYFSSLTVSLNSSIFGERNWLWAFCITSWMESCDGDYYIFCAFQVFSLWNIFGYKQKYYTSRLAKTEYWIYCSTQFEYIIRSDRYHLNTCVQTNVYSLHFRTPFRNRLIIIKFAYHLSKFQIMKRLLASNTFRLPAISPLAPACHLVGHIDHALVLRRRHDDGHIVQN